MHITEEQIMESIENYQDDVERGNALRRLEGNPDFISLISEGYFKTFAANQVLISADARLNPEDKEQVIENIRAISCFYQYLHTIVLQSDRATKQIEKGIEELNAMRSEQTQQ